MKYANVILSVAFAASVSAFPLRIRDIDASLAPPLGGVAGVNPDGHGNCDGAVNGANGQPILVPCACPPDEATYLAALNANVAAGHAVHNPSVAVSFPTDDSTASKIARVQAALVTIQNLNGEGVGCPASSTTLSGQLSSLQNGTPFPASQAGTPASTPAAAPPPPPSPAPAPAAPPASGSGGANGLSLSQIDALTPQFGVTAGTNPDGHGNCDGVNGANGQPILIPCSCPPPRDQFIQDLAADIAAGHAVNNPSVSVSFPTDSSTASQLARNQAATVALQNLFGSGVGCPASSTTFVAQAKALQG